MVVITINMNINNVMVTTMQRHNFGEYFLVKSKLKQDFVSGQLISPDIDLDRMVSVDIVTSISPVELSSHLK